MTKQSNPFADLFSNNDFSRLMENYQNLPFDMNTFMDTQRKNMQALSEAQQVAIDNMQVIAKRQAEIISQMVEDNSAIAKQFMSEGTPEQKIAQNADIFKAMYEKSVKNMNEISELLTQSNQDATNIINKRVTATMNEVKSSLAELQKKAA